MISQTLRCVTEVATGFREMARPIPSPPPAQEFWSHLGADCIRPGTRGAIRRPERGAPAISGRAAVCSIPHHCERCFHYTEFMKRCQKKTRSRAEKSTRGEALTNRSTICIKICL